MTIQRTLSGVAVLVLIASCVHRTPNYPAPIPRVDAKPFTTFALREIDISPGTGAAVAPRKCVYAHYTGWLTDGKKFDSSRDTMPDGRPREPISFPQGARRVIAGWDIGFEGMRVGAKRRLIIPYQLAYGEAGRPPLNPPKSELLFDVELMAGGAAPARPRPGPRRGAAPPPPGPGRGAGRQHPSR